MIEVASDRDHGDHSEQEAACAKEMVGHEGSRLRSGAWVESNGWGSGGESKRSRDRWNGRHGRSVANGLGNKGRREGRFYSPGMLTSG